MKYRSVYKNGACVAKFENDALVWASPEYLKDDAAPTHMVMPDIQPYRSMIDGSVIQSRSSHREHLKQHNCFEVGNETKHMVNRAGPLKAPPGLKRTLVEIANAKLRSA